MRRLLLQADDFGLSDGVTEGILISIERGIVGGASAMVCEPECRERTARFAHRAAGRIGLHLQLTDGVPVSDPAAIPTLVNSEGVFPRKRELIGAPDSGQLLTEWRAQLAAIRSIGIEPVHLDTHHSVHFLPEVNAVYRQMAIETGIPVRGGMAAMNREMQAQGILCCDQYACVWSGAPVKPEALLRALRVLALYMPENGLAEVGCHPARVDEDLLRRSEYAYQRERELELLCDETLRRGIEALGFSPGHGGKSIPQSA